MDEMMLNAFVHNDRNYTFLFGGGGIGPKQPASINGSSVDQKVFLWCHSPSPGGEMIIVNTYKCQCLIKFPEGYSHYSSQNLFYRA